MAEVWIAAIGTGHRPATRRKPDDGLTAAMLPWVRAEARDKLTKLRDEHGCREVHSGLALGWDIIIGQVCLDLGMALHVHIPYESQPDVWPDRAARDEWARLRDAAVWERVYGPNPHGMAEAKRLLHLRNDGLLDVAERTSGVVFGCWRPSKPWGGTASALRKAAERGLPVIHVNPDTRTTHAPGCRCVTRLA